MLPPRKVSTPLESRQRPERLTLLDTIRARGILVASSPGAVDLWALAENETLVGSKFYKYEQMTLCYRVLGCGTKAVRGNKDFCIKIRDLAQQVVLNPDRAHSGRVTCIAASPHKDSMFLFF